MLTPASMLEPVLSIDFLVIKHQVCILQSFSQAMAYEVAEYLVSSLPDIDYDLDEMYSGQIPISTNDTSRSLFYVFQPTIGEPVDEITIWFNGGPGCSSLEGFLQENGRFIWGWGMYSAVENPYTWVNLTNVLW